MGIHDACPVHEEPYRICGCEEDQDFSCKVCGQPDADWDDYVGELRCFTHSHEVNNQDICIEGCAKHDYIHDPDPEYYGGPDYDLARDMDRGK